MSKKLTIGMATYDDMHGVIFTVQSLRMNILEYGLEDDVEIVIVDNKPEGEHGNKIRGFLNNKSKIETNYYPYHVEGTTQSRNFVFEVAKGEYVICLDCHVLLTPNALINVLAKIANDEIGDDIWSGPLLYSGMQNTSSHFDPVWRSEMWGIWGTAWEKDGLYFTSRRSKTEKVDLLEMKSGSMLKPAIVASEVCPWHRHEDWMLDNGYRVAADLPDPFEIPGQGLGLFMAKKSSWLGFNEHFRGFGGEELYIHEKYRQAGRRAMCLPQLKWWHRFERLGIPYPVSLHNKVRNYVIGHQELDLPLGSVYEHFVGNRRYPINRWNALIQDPVGYPADRDLSRVTKDIGDGSNIVTRDQLFQMWKSQERDLNHHFDTIKNFTEKCETVVEYSSRKESPFAILGGNPKKFTSYNFERSKVLLEIPKIVEDVKDINTDFEILIGETWYRDDEDEYDMLFIDHQHTTYEEMKQHLDWAKTHVTKYIVIHDTTAYGEDKDGKPAMKHALQEFLEEFPQWFFLYHTDYQYGLTVMSCCEERPQYKVHPWNPGYGVGKETTAILEKFGFVATKNCSCKQKASLMDRLGIEWCSDNKDTIAGWLTDEWDKHLKRVAKLEQKRSILNKAATLIGAIGGDRFREMGAHNIINKAIKRATVQREKMEKLTWTK